MSADPLAHFRALIDIYETGIVWHCVCALARLEVPDRLADGPLPVSQLAADTGVHEDPLRRRRRGGPPRAGLADEPFRFWRRPCGPGTR
jgi:hypothetical protein